MVMLVQQTSRLQDEIQRLKKQKDVVILAHNYQIPDVQDVADFVGDSLGLSRQAAKVDNKTILFCGVHFMAETAARAIAVGYVNTTAEIKSELDYCCTSSNAVNVVNAIPKDKEILFLPDMFLGAYVSKMTGRKNMHIWAGECHVHAGITAEDVQKKLDQMANAEFLVHPECSCTTPMLYDIAAGDYDNRQVHILSTEGMMNHVKNSSSQQFVVATETGILYRMKQQNPEKTFVPASEKAECQYMKMINLEKVYTSLLEDKYEVKVPKEIADKARLSIERMLSIS
jgi:quinolinate synthase